MLKTRRSPGSGENDPCCYHRPFEWNWVPAGFPDEFRRIWNRRRFLAYPPILYLKKRRSLRDEFTAQPYPPVSTESRLALQSQLSPAWSQRGLDREYPNARSPVLSLARTMRRSLQRPFTRSSDATAHRTGLFNVANLCLYFLMRFHDINHYRNGSLVDRLIHRPSASYTTIALQELIKSTR